ncbi:MAG: OmpA family protein [Spirochaetaceae bacterium]|jgi:flagellar hook assembly protein FlgD|nr:OmpA family protein [Spirochaetaceae bacterium]
MKKQTAGKFLLILISLTILIMSYGVTAQTPPQTEPPMAAYISPNNDGVKDTLVVPFSITDKRYIKEWRLLITDENGNIVRTIANKDSRPVSLNFKEFWRIITTPKQSVAVPASVVWDGAMDSGEVAPDGVYFYALQASDDNGNSAESEKRIVVVDCTPPEVEITQPSASDKFFGEGAKSSIRIRERGSREDLWTASVTDTSDNVVRSWTFTDAEPADIVWDGRSNEGSLVIDGVYSYTIKSTDRAGNVSPPARVSNIVYSGDKPVTNITLSGRYFSPSTSLSELPADGDTRIKTITLTPSIPTPSTGNSLQNWRIEVIDSSMQVKRRYTGSSSVPANIVFDGFDDAGRALSEGAYRARLVASYLNGYTTPEKLSPDFILDRTKPQASLNLPDNIFSPNGDGDKDAVLLRQTLSQENTPWRGEIVNAQGGAVRHFELGVKPSPEILWNGISDSGALCPDGDYTYRVLCTDLAGNFASAVSLPFILDNSATELIISAAPEAFSPNGDGVQDSVRFSITSKSESGIVQYSLTIVDAINNPVRAFNGNGALPPSVTWDGKADGGAAAAEGLYYAKLSAVARNGNISNVSAGPVLLDLTPPAAMVNAPYLLFDPEPDSRRAALPLVITTEPERLWTGVIQPAGGGASTPPVRSFAWYDGTADSFEWDGTDDSGNLVKDGVYRFTLSAQDPAGNRASVELGNITVDTRPVRAWITTAYETIAPNGNNTKSQIFEINSTPKDGVSDWVFKIVNVENIDGGPVKVWQGSGDTVPASLEWDGRLSDGSAADGLFMGVLEAAYTRGKNVSTESPAFVCSAQPPVISAVARPEFFSPDNDGVDDEERITLSAFSYLPFESWSFEVFDPQGRNLFWSASGKSQITRELVWDGRSKTGELVQSAMDYPYTFTVTDIEGQISKAFGVLRVDVLVIRDGDKLRMQVPAIIFRADHADFVSKAQDPQQGIEQSVIDNNMRVLRRIAQILNKFKDYTVVIEGHAHNVSGTEAEETSRAGGNIPLVPLSKERADFVKQQLVKLGVGAGRMTTDGQGGKRPIANPADRDDWWKDRRVEFILNK